MNQAPQHEEGLFHAALQLTGSARTLFLDQECGGEPDFRRRLEALLAAHDATDSLLADQTEATGPALVSRLAEVPDEAVGMTIGRYKLLEKVGEGGCGVVYVAEQTEPIRRRVALKVIKLGMDTKQVVARFEAERQALALMDHPHIARVLDAGPTDKGRPYFVMELVPGIRITEYCDQNQLSTRDRLDLFMRVCHAIQHAHQKGIIHRDIKPSNILVTLQDSVPVPKVIDFGIAKATEGRLTEATVYTQLHQFIGTPAYMSPEQAEMSGLDIDTRSDIYSLGVLLYELLTGKTPFDGQELLASGIDAMRKTIREREPLRPSTRLCSLPRAELTTTAKRRSEAPPKLVHLIEGDLDWIVMKCLEKDRAKRYDTANGVAADLKRHLNNEPVLARPPNALDRLRKAWARYKLAFAAMGAVFLALITGLALATWALARERAARHQARTEAVRSQHVAVFLEGMLRGAGPTAALGRDTTILREILDKTAARLAQDLEDQPAVQAELMNTIGGVYLELAELQKAEAMHRGALALYRSHLGSQRPETAQSLSLLAHALQKQSKEPEAEIVLREALRTRRRLFGNQHVLVAATIIDLADVLLWQGKLEEGETQSREALAIHRKLFGNQGLDVCNSLEILSNILAAKGQLNEAENVMRESMVMKAGLLDPKNPERVTSEFSLARVLEQQGRLPEAETIHRQVLSIRRNLLGNEHRDVAISIERVAEILILRHNLAEAEALVRECLAIRQKKLPEDWNTYSVLSLLGSILLEQSDYAEAEPWLLAGYQGVMQRENRIPGLVKQSRLNETVERLVRLYRCWGKPAKAAEWEQTLEGLVAQASSEARPNF